VVYYWNGSAYKVTTGASVKNWSDLGSYSGNMFYANNSNGFHYTALAYLQLSATPDSGDLSYGWITSTPVLVKDGDDYYLQMNIWTGSSSETYLAEKYNNTAIDGSATSFLTVGSGTNPDSLTYLKKGYPVVFSDNGDGTITNLSSFVGAINSVVGYADGADDVAFDMAIPGASGTGIRTLTITDDTIILYVDTENDIGYAGGSIEIAEQEEDDDYIPNCYVLANGSDEIKVIVVDSTNEADTLPPV
jgi:hypothetical protein